MAGGRGLRLEHERVSTERQVESGRAISSRHAARTSSVRYSLTGGSETAELLPA